MPQINKIGLQWSFIIFIFALRMFKALNFSSSNKESNNLFFYFVVYRFKQRDFNLLTNSDAEKMEQIILDKLVDDLVDNQFGWLDNVLTEVELDGLISLIKDYNDEDALRKAAIGNFDNHQVNKQVRGDWIKWVNKQEPHANIKSYLNCVQEVVTYLNRTLYLGLKDYEMHYTLYPKGTRYMRHRDQFQTTQHRRISFVLYLNKDWKPDMGGELILYNDKNQATVIAPKFGRLALFFSYLEHEVTLTKFDRKSITGWMLDVPVSLSFLNK